MTEAFFIKMNGALYPASDSDRELLGKIKAGQPTRLTFKRVRNYQFHKKWFSLLNLAFDYWEPPEEFLQTLAGKQIGLVPEKNFDRFRKDIVILSGFYESSFRINGETRIEAKSISFANMTEDEFEALYSKTIDVIIKYVLTNYTGEMLRSVVEQVEEYG